MGRNGFHNAYDAANAQRCGKSAFYLPKKKHTAEASRSVAAMEMASFLISNPQANIEQAKKRMCVKHRIACLKNSEILRFIPHSNLPLRARLLKSPTRTLSGVSPVALMPRPYPCVGRCIYCPKGKNAPQSYTGFEPTTMRAIQCGYSAKKQVGSRIQQYRQQGHCTDKCHLIFMGGTLLASPARYRREFVKESFDSLNGSKSGSLSAAINSNEHAKSRAIGVTFETRPDFSKEKDVDEMLLLGGTQVELGVQALSDQVYRKVRRNHTVLDVERATRILKDSGFKVCYHMMPGLFSTPDQDILYFRRLFSTSRFQPDMLKIYPVLVLRGTKLYEEWKKGRFSPYGTDEAAEVIALATKYVPPYVRVPRIQRDIPSPLVVAGVKNSNLRQIVDQKLHQTGGFCRCIRCREVGSNARKNIKPVKLSLSLLRQDYAASGGKEIFLSFEDKKQDLLAGFLRLRIPSQSHRAEIFDGKNLLSSIVRELHVYGPEASIGERTEAKQQHKGLGQTLLFEAERITKKEFGLGKISVLSGPGARGYYRKSGYSLNGPYMQKKI